MPEITMPKLSDPPSLRYGEAGTMSSSQRLATGHS
jgi:hypothetical protein